MATGLSFPSPKPDHLELLCVAGFLCWSHSFCLTRCARRTVLLRTPLNSPPPRGLIPVGTMPDSVLPDSSNIIRYVDIRRSDVFDSSEAKNWATKLVNDLHIVTMPGVVNRELLLKEGEPWDSARAAETARNLRRLGVFRKVSVDSVTTDSGLVMLVQT